jgi:hypothetical protein
MRTHAEIMQRFQETDDEITEKVLAWVLESGDGVCPMCSNHDWSNYISPS